MIDRNDRRLNELVGKYEGCGNVGISKRRTSPNQKRNYRPYEEIMKFKCCRFGLVCETEVACLIYETSCMA